MRNLITIITAACMVGFAPTAATAAPSLPIQGEIKAAVTAAMKEFNIPGANLVVETQGTRWVQSFGYGRYAIKQPVTPRDYFATRSITKSFVVTALMQLIADSKGAMSLNDPIGKYLPNIPNGATITLRQLANMRSGLYDYTEDPDFGAAFSADLLRSWTADQLLKFALYSNKHGPANFAPGARYQYSNTNTLLLGKVVELRTGRPFAATLNAAILKPYGLGSTVYLNGVALPAPRTVGYQGFYDLRPEAIAVNATALNFSGAMAMTISDLATWGKLLVSGNLLPAGLQAQRFNGSLTAIDPQSPLYDRYGLGMGEIAGWWGHTGSGVGYEAAVFHSPDKNETFAIMVNASNSTNSPARIFCRVLHILHPGETRPAKSVCDREP